MKLLAYESLNTTGLKKQFDKVCKMLEKGDFKSAEVKKMSQGRYYRAKLDYENRLLFQFAKNEDETYILLLEIIRNHEYEKSRFLKGAKVDESKLPALHKADDLKSDDAQNISYINPQSSHFHVLDKVIVFDDVQNEVTGLPVPLIIIGSAGSGKTALSLEKMKMLTGKVLYTTHSQFLVENSRTIYYSNNYENDKQEIDFLSFNELLETISIPNGREVTYNDFRRWFERQRQNFKIKNPHKLFEEFRGVLTGMNITKPHLTLEDYEGLGIKQSIFPVEERAEVHAVFTKYLAFLKENNLYDTNIVSFEYVNRVVADYDYVVVDEIQDLTNIQVNLILKSLKKAVNFMLCGDSNQIVHPNFFSWANVKTMFYESKIKSRADIIRILHTNYRT